MTIAQASATPFLFGDHDRERGAGTDVLGNGRKRGGAAGLWPAAPPCEFDRPV